VEGLFGNRKTPKEYEAGIAALQAKVATLEREIQGHRAEKEDALRKAKLWDPKVPPVKQHPCLWPQVGIQGDISDAHFGAICTSCQASIALQPDRLNRFLAALMRTEEAEQYRGSVDFGSYVVAEEVLERMTNLKTFPVCFRRRLLKIVATHRPSHSGQDSDKLWTEAGRTFR